MTEHIDRTVPDDEPRRDTPAPTEPVERPAERPAEAPAERPAEAPPRKEPPETAREPVPGIRHEPEPDGENIIPSKKGPGTL
jgi:hypothetical protein